MPQTAFIVVDYQFDFLPSGPLAVPAGDQIAPELIRQAEEADVVVCTRDWHPSDHCSFAEDPRFTDGSWPMHCVHFSRGALIEPRLFLALCGLRKPLFLVDKGTDPNAEAYSGFEGVVCGSEEKLVDLLERHSVRNVKIGGLALDYCVAATALHAQERFETSVIIEATRPVNYTTGARAIVSLIQAGVSIV